MEVLFYIHRHGLSEEVAFEVEAALIDAYLDLTNINNGNYSNEFGLMTDAEVMQLYSTEYASINSDTKILFLNLNLNSDMIGNLEGIQRAVSFAWKLSKKRAERADYVLATFRGRIIGVFTAKNWRIATTENFQNREEYFKDRYGFDANVVCEEISSLYVNKLVPAEYRAQGASNPVRYTYK